MSYKNLKLEKCMYGVSGKSFSDVLEEMDPSQNYYGTSLGELDAYERQLKRFDIKVSGANSDTVEKFFQTSDAAALFPEFLSRAVKVGMSETNHLADIIATTTKVDSLDYRSIASVPTDAEKSLSDVEEGAAIPETVVHPKSSLVSLTKTGRMLCASYEALKFQKLDLFSVTLKQIGAYIANTQFKKAVDVLINGDGNSNAAKVLTVTESGTLTYADLIKLWNDFSDYQLNTILVSPDVMLKMLSIEEFKNPATGLNFQATGTLTTPLGAKLIKSSAVPEGTIVGLDKNCALEMVTASDVLVEYDKLIDRQLERAAITTISGFAKIFDDASKVLTV